MRSKFSEQSRRSVSLATCFWSLLLLAQAHAQASATSPSQSFLMQGPADQSDIGVIRDALGRPCLDVEAAARAHVVNPNLFDHVVSIKSNCVRPIKVKLCYFQSDACKEIVVPGYKRVDTILGTMTNVSRFRYSLIQK